MVNDHLTPCFPASTPRVHLLQHTHKHTQPLAKLSGSDFSLGISL